MAQNVRLVNEAGTVTVSKNPVPVKSVNYHLERVRHGQAWRATVDYTTATNAASYYMVEVPNTTTANGFYLSVQSDQNCTFNIYDAGTVSSDGTTATNWNLNQNTTTSSKVKVTLSPTLAASQTSTNLIDKYQVTANASPEYIASFAELEAPFVGGAGVKYIIKAIPSATTTSRVLRAAWGDSVDEDA